MSLYSFSTDTMLSRIARLEDSVPLLINGGTFAANRYATQTSVPLAAVSNGLIDLTGTGIQTIGSIPPSVNTSGFAATATTTSITWYWDGTNASSVIVLKRADKTQRVIPANSITVNSLSANTWYGFLPYWTEANTCGVGWIPGDSGVPLIAFAGGTGASFVPTATSAALTNAAIAQLFQGREQLSSGFMTFKTPAAGTSGGAASGGGDPGSGACVMVGTDIETLGDLEYASKMFKQSEWRRLLVSSGKSINCTPDHPLYEPERGRQKAECFKRGDWIITELGEQKIVDAGSFRRVCTKVKVEMPVGHLFWANGFLSHNSKSPYRSL
jgi:hypothetical protein